MTEPTLTPQSKEIVSRLYSSNEYNKREAIYRILFDRRTDLLPELKKAVKYEKDERIAVFMVQVCLTLTNFPRDPEIEERILKLLQHEDKEGVNALTSRMWKYLENCATSQMTIAILGAMGNSIPSNGHEFIETCLNHPDPDIRAIACEKALQSGRPTHFAYTLNLVADKDPIVSQTAFMAIKNLPENELAIILDYALGSPDEWVLNTIAPFLPNLITPNLRSVISKVQYHSNQNVAHKAREALKILDAVPYITRRSIKDHDEAEKRKLEEKIQKQKTNVLVEDEKKISFKEQLEIKRKEKEAEELKKKEAEEALDRELASIEAKEMEDFTKTIDGYDAILPDETAVEPQNTEPTFPDEKQLIENMDFAKEAEFLANIEEEEIKDTFREEQVATSLMQPGLDLEAESEHHSSPNQEPETAKEEAKESIVEKEPTTSLMQTGLDLEAEAKHYPSPNQEPETAKEEAKESIVEEKPATSLMQTGLDLEAEAKHYPSLNQEPKTAKAASSKEVTQMNSIAVPANFKEIFTKYPSFLTTPLLEVFRADKEEKKLEQIEKTLDNLTAFLNICFLQSAMYYANESEILTKSIKECIKANLIGPSALRCLHNFVLAMKTVRENPVFFTFPLSKIMSESSETNPLIMMRELKEYLKDPGKPLCETVPQAIDGLLETLKLLRAITANTLLMRSPKGAKQPYANLSGPSAKVLPYEQRPAIDLPVGEVVLVSTTKTEAFGLFPFFKYSKKKILFGIPSKDELTTFYERLEITPD